MEWVWRHGFSEFVNVVVGSHFSHSQCRHPNSLSKKDIMCVIEESLQKIGNNLSEWKKMNDQFMEMFHKLKNDDILLIKDGHTAHGTVTKREDYEIYELEFDKGFKTIQHGHEKSKEHHIVIKGCIKVTQGGGEKVLTEGESIYTPEKQLHVFEALEPSVVVSLVIPKLE